MLVRHIMCTELFALEPETPVVVALRALRKRRIRRAPILDSEGHLMGFLTERDLLRAVPGTVAEVEGEAGRAALGRTALSVAAKRVSTAHPDDHIEDIARLFLWKKIGGVPVVEGRRVVGVITESDIFRAVVGAAHLADATRFTVQRSHATRIKPALDVVRSLRLELVGLVEYPGPGGRDVLVLRVRGRRVQELGTALTRAGWVLLDRREAGPEEPE